MKKFNPLTLNYFNIYLYRGYVIYIYYGDSERYDLDIYNGNTGKMVVETYGTEVYNTTFQMAKNFINDHLEIGGNYYEE